MDSLGYLDLQLLQRYDITYKGFSLQLRDQEPLHSRRSSIKQNDAIIDQCHLDIDTLEHDNQRLKYDKQELGMQIRKLQYQNRSLGEELDRTRLGKEESDDRAKAGKAEYERIATEFRSKLQAHDELATTCRVLENALANARKENGQMRKQLRHEIHLRRAGTKAELLAKRKLKHVAGLYHYLCSRVSELEHNKKGLLLQASRAMNTTTIKRRLDGFASLLTECHIILNNINRQSRAEAEYLHDLTHLISCTTASELVQKVNQSTQRRYAMEIAAINNIQQEWDYMLDRERLYDELRTAEMTLYKIKDIDDETLRMALQGFQVAWITKMPVHDSLRGHILHIKKVIDGIEQKRLGHWTESINCLVGRMSEYDQLQFSILRAGRIAGLRTLVEDGHTGGMHLVCGALDIMTKMENAQSSDGCLFCADDSCKGC